MPSIRQRLQSLLTRQSSSASQTVGETECGQPTHQYSARELKKPVNTTFTEVTTSHPAKFDEKTALAPQAAAPLVGSLAPKANA